MVVPIGMFLGGIALVAAAVVTGEADVSLVLIIPVFSGSSALFLLGVLLIVASFIVGFVLVATGSVEVEPSQGAQETASPMSTGSRRTEYGGVVLVGPIPIAFGSSRNMAIVMLVIGVVATVLLLGLMLAL